MRTYLRDWHKLKLKDNVLYRTTTVSGEEYDQVIVLSTIKDTILHSLHDDMGHQGHDKTSWLVKTKFFWIGMDSDIENKVRHCGRCVRQKTCAVLATELVNITSSAPVELVCIDYLSLDMSKGRYENILVITDHFTRYSITGNPMCCLWFMPTTQLGMTLQDFLFYVRPSPQVGVRCLPLS